MLQRQGVARVKVERRWPWLGGQDDKPPSAFQLFNAIIVVRWLSLALASASYLRNLSTREMDYGNFFPALALALVYLLALTFFSDTAYRLRSTGPALLIVDYAVSFAILSLSAGLWTPFFIYVLCSTMMAGLLGHRGSGVAGGIALSALYLLALPIKGVTSQAVLDADGGALVIVYNLEILVFSVIWSYAASLVARFNEAVRNAADAGDAVATANAHLDRHQNELLAIHAVRGAALTLTDLDEISLVVLDAVRKAGFRDPRIHLANHDAPPVREGDEAARIEDGDVVLGTLLVQSPVGGLSAEEARLLSLFADQIALAIQHVRLFERGREHAVAGERNRIAIDIHDVVLQAIYGANLLAESLPDEGFEDAARKDLRTLRDAVKRSLRELRVAVLNWDSLGWSLPLLAIADRYLEEFGEIADLRVQLSAYGVEREADAEKKKELLAILQEALSNSWRHARAASVTVAVAFEAENVCLSVRDDGHGFDPTLDRERWTGLATIHERAERHAGRVFLASAPGEGTQVRVEMPW